jgi:hypothetical protein
MFGGTRTEVAMSIRASLMLFGFLSLAALARSAQTGEAHPRAPKLEARLLKALGDLNKETIGELAKEVGRLEEEDRRLLPFRVRTGSVEFRFSGECPGHPEYVEFVVSSKNRDYESLLVLSKAELQRSEQVWKVVERLAKAGELKSVAYKKFLGVSPREPALQLNLVFVVKGQARSENLDNLLLKKEGAYLDWEEDGARLNGDRKLDRALVPPMRQPAQLIVIVRPAFLNP